MAAQSAFFNAAAQPKPTPEQIRAELERRMKQGGDKTRDLAGDNLALLTNEELRSLIYESGVDIKTIYGPDDRADWYEIRSETVKELALASVAMVDPNDITLANDRFTIKERTLGERQDLCPNEKFSDQPAAAFCSGVLIDEDLVLTAGHCVREISGAGNVPNAADIHFVFGYKVVDKLQGAETEFTEKQVYRGKESVGGALRDTEDGKEDWAVVRLANKVPADIAKPMKLWRATEVEEGVDVYVIGYPSGLPLKYAPNARVREAKKKNFFVANLDTFGGNSGSPVFDGQHHLAGILVRGATDYVPAGGGKNCRIANVCPTTGCRGEDVTRISLIKSRLGN